MSSHAEQHFVPRFLLEHWHGGTDSKLTAFRWARGRLVSHRYKAKSVAKARHLYSLERSLGEPNTEVESRFLGPLVDEPAARVHRLILAEGVRALSDDDKRDWAAFLVSLMLRVPRMVSVLRERGRSILASGLDERPEEYEKVRADAAEPTLSEWVREHAPDTLDDLGVRTLPSLIFSEKLNRAVLGSLWTSIRLEGSRFDLLISDQPFLLAGTFATRYVVALPVSPTRLFCSVSDRALHDQIRARPLDEIARMANVSTVDCADRYVFATGHRHEALIRKYLRKPMVDSSSGDGFHAA